MGDFVEKIIESIFYILRGLWYLIRAVICVILLCAIVWGLLLGLFHTFLWIRVAVVSIIILTISYFIGQDKTYYKGK